MQLKTCLIALVTFVASLSTGCATVRPCSTTLPTASRSGGTVMTPYRVQGANNTCIQAFEWKEERTPARGAVVVIHGVRDHASRYSALAEALTQRGLAVYAQDHRGHGYSGGDRQRFDSMGELVSDVNLAVEEAKQRNPGVPIFLYGHSMGGLVATHYALEHGGQLRGVVLSGAALKLQPSVTGGQKTAVRIFGAVLPGLPAQPIDDSEFVREPAAQKELAEDPLIDHANLPARTASAVLKAIENLETRMEEVKVPLLILHGLADKATNVEGSRELAARAGTSDKTLRLYEGVYHDLMHEPERDAIISDVTSWMTARLGEK
ncbi:MAG TPA: alpha/beta hydrolase [Archangium sp.]|nr:alpha/beta hydrolase [Archangium sp.]